MSVIAQDTYVTTRFAKHVTEYRLRQLVLSIPSRLYKAMGEFDVLRGIFGGLIDTKDVTRQAIQAEARGDYAAALKLYGEVSPQRFSS